ncbi:MAG: right-handed parallel beta-helix repeat-containing protein [Nitrospira sp.]|nr:MAG: right-handed parallel beta-helix repeat-containing protein [Nitrospira sp.]
MKNFGVNACLALAALVVCIDPTHGGGLHENAQGEGVGIVDLMDFGAVGDGVSDDTAPVQRALSLCSSQGLSCVVTTGKQFLIRGPLYIWGKAHLVGDKLQGALIFDVHESPYLINVGLSGRQKLERAFSGTITGISFKVIGGEGGRLFFLWRTDGALIGDNHFDFGPFRYSATSSGNDNDVVKNGFTNCIRKNITIAHNTIVAAADYDGSEGIGLGHFDGALILANKVYGVGDDPIGIHFSKNIRILDNDLSSVDGRIFVVNSQHVTIANNRHERVRSPKDGRFYEGISLLYIGFETLEANSYAAPTDILVEQNTLYYPPGAIDKGAAIYLYGPRDVSVEKNKITNDSSDVHAAAVRVLPAVFSKRWNDPDSKDPASVARVHDTAIVENRSEGAYPLGIGMTGNCDAYAGHVVVQGNVAPTYSFYCNNISLSGNKSTQRGR